MPAKKTASYMQCYQLCLKAYDAKEYCLGDSKQHPARNPWGCIRICMPIGAEQDWLCYGHFDIDGTFIFDKKRIEHYVFSSLKEFRECPALDIERVRKIMDAFPETINPRIDKDWRYQEPVFHKLEARVSIKCGNGELNAIGVKPASIEAVERIIHKLLKKAT